MEGLLKGTDGRSIVDGQHVIDQTVVLYGQVRGSVLRDEEGKHNVTPYPVQLIRWQCRGSNYGHEFHLAIQFLIEYKTGVDLSHLKPQQALEVRVPLLGVQLEWVE